VLIRSRRGASADGFTTRLGRTMRAFAEPGALDQLEVAGAMVTGDATGMPAVEQAVAWAHLLGKSELLVRASRVRDQPSRCPGGLVAIPMVEWAWPTHSAVDWALEPRCRHPMGHRVGFQRAASAPAVGPAGKPGARAATGAGPWPPHLLLVMPLTALPQLSTEHVGHTQQPVVHVPVPCPDRRPSHGCAQR
jgi:hypothetical protein